MSYHKYFAQARLTQLRRYGQIETALLIEHINPKLLDPFMS